MNKLALLFHSEVRAEVLRLLFGAGNERRYRAEIIGLTKFAAASVEEELQKLVYLQLLVSSKDGNRRYYSANPGHPLYPELQGIVRKSAGRRAARRPARTVAALAETAAPAAGGGSLTLGAPFDDATSPETMMHLR